MSDLQPDPSLRAAVPVNHLCIYCGERVRHDDSVGQPIMNERGVWVFPHRECALRQVLGGIGHIRDHAYWCGKMHDPDAGLGYRQSARLVWQWVVANGTEATAERSAQQLGTDLG